ATIATPNLPEARILAELPDGTPDECAEKLLPKIRHLLITGGHGEESDVVNRLYSRDGQTWSSTCARLPGSYHGSGCTLASALAGRLALGEALPGAVESALDYTWRCPRGLYAITDSALLADGRLLPYVEAALEGGARLLQYREKSRDAARRFDEASALRELCQRYGAVLIINDDLELAVQLGVGLHLGQEDGSLVAGTRSEEHTSELQSRENIV